MLLAERCCGVLRTPNATILSLADSWGSRIITPSLGRDSVVGRCLSCIGLGLLCRAGPALNRVDCGLFAQPAPPERELPKYEQRLRLFQCVQITYPWPAVLTPAP